VVFYAQECSANASYFKPFNPRCSSDQPIETTSKSARKCANSHRRTNVAHTTNAGVIFMTHLGLYTAPARTVPDR